MAELRPRVWVSQPLFDDIVERLHAHFDVLQVPDVGEHDASAIADALREVELTSPAFTIDCMTLDR